MKTPPSCDCCERLRRPSRELHLHREIQDTGTDAWKRLLDEIEYVAVQELEVYAPGQTLDREEWQSIVTLPASIAKLKSVKRLILCGSSLVRLPPAIGEMSALYEFDAYMSYRLHWLPYEIARCTNLRESRISTRALYGNYKRRSPFPNLRAEVNSSALDLTRPNECSVCKKAFSDRQPVLHRWISLWIATDVLPLLVYACSNECLEALPALPENYVNQPHFGGSSLEQPPPSGW